MVGMKTAKSKAKPKAKSAAKANSKSAAKVPAKASASKAKPSAKSAAKTKSTAKAKAPAKANTRKASSKAKASTSQPSTSKAKTKAKGSTSASKAKSAAKAKTSKAKGAVSSSPASGASQQIDAKIASLGDWRGKTLGRLRALIQRADPQVVEEVKWGGVPVWSHDGIICTGETYKSMVKLTFAKGASVADPKKLFNSSLEGNTRRAIDVSEGDKLDEKAFQELVRGAVALNAAKPAKASKKA